MIMKKNFFQHLPHYFSLFGLLAVSAFGFHLFEYDENFQLAIIISASISYVAWGVVHHKIHDDLKLSVVAEYAIFALLGIIIVASVLSR